MSTSIIVEGKILGQKQPLFKDWHINITPEWQGGSDCIRLRDLITYVVVEEVNAFRQRQTERKLARIMSRGEIEQASSSGKVDPGERNLKQEVNIDEAVGTALQAFEDGLYYVFIDGIQQTDLHSELYIKSESKVTFIRLVALTGG